MGLEASVLRPGAPGIVGGAAAEVGVHSGLLLAAGVGAEGLGAAGGRLDERGAAGWAGRRGRVVGQQVR